MESHYGETQERFGVLQPKMDQSTYFHQSVWKKREPACKNLKLDQKCLTKYMQRSKYQNKCKIKYVLFNFLMRNSAYKHYPHRYCSTVPMEMHIYALPLIKVKRAFQVEEYMAYRKLPRVTRQKISEYFEHRYQVGSICYQS